MEEKASILKKDSHIMRILVIWLINVDIRLFRTFIHLGKLQRYLRITISEKLNVPIHRLQEGHPLNPEKKGEDKNSRE